MMMIQPNVRFGTAQKPNKPVQQQPAAPVDANAKKEANRIDFEVRNAIMEFTGGAPGIIGMKMALKIPVTKEEEATFDKIDGVFKQIMADDQWAKAIADHDMEAVFKMVEMLEKQGVEVSK